MRSFKAISHRALRVSVGAAFVVAAGASCFAVTNTTAVQCTSEKECLGLGPDFAGSTCDPATKTCVKPADSQGCTSNRQCLDEAGGEPAICTKGERRRCVRLKTPECPTIFTQQGNGELANDDVIVLGALTPMNHTELGSVMERAVEMAHHEISTGFSKGLPQAGGSAGSRPIAVVACREFGGGLEGLLRAANHLAKDVGTPLVIGPVDPGNSGFVASQVFLPNRVLNILPTAIISSLANLPSPIAPTPLVWRMPYDDKSIGQVISRFVSEQLEPKLLADGVQPPYRFAMVAGADPSSQALQDQLVNELQAAKFNGGKTVTENQAEGSCAIPGDSETAKRKCFEVFNFGNIYDTLVNPNPDAKIASTVTAVWNYQPHVIFHAYGPAGIPKAYFPIEGGFPGTRKPYHVGVGSVWNGFGPLFPFMNQLPGRNARMFAAQQYSSTKAPPFPLDNTVVQTWLQRFNTKFPEFEKSVSPKSQNVWIMYDAMYLAAYAIVAVGDKPLNGENLAHTLGRFNDGELISTYYSPGGPNGPEMDKAYAELKAGRNIDLQGLFGHMNFDVATGAPTYGLEMTCPDKSNPAGGTKGSGYHYIVKQGTVVTNPAGENLIGTSPLNGCPGPTD